ncbi:hypothetical protein MRX96_056910 [Rhipicephalus microplus]
MANESHIDLSIPFVPEQRPTLLLTTVPDLYASLSRIAVSDPTTKSSTTSPLQSCQSTHSTGYEPSKEDPASNVIACPPELLAHIPAVNRAPDFPATSDYAPATALDGSRDHEPLLTLEAEATLAQEADDRKASTLEYFLIGTLFAGLVITAALAIANAPGGPPAAHDMLPEEEQPNGTLQVSLLERSTQRGPGPGTDGCCSKLLTVNTSRHGAY